MHNPAAEAVETAASGAFRAVHTAGHTFGKNSAVFRKKNDRCRAEITGVLKRDAPSPGMAGCAQSRHRSPPADAFGERRRGAARYRDLVRQSRAGCQFCPRAAVWVLFCHPLPSAHTREGGIVCCRFRHTTEAWEFLKGCILLRLPSRAFCTD